MFQRMNRLRRASWTVHLRLAIAALDHLARPAQSPNRASECPNTMACSPFRGSARFRYLASPISYLTTNASWILSATSVGVMVVG